MARGRRAPALGGWAAAALAACGAGRAGAADGVGRSLLIGVMSTLPDRERRTAMRETWVGEARRLRPSLVAVRFVLGRPGSAAQRGEIEQDECHPRRPRRAALRREPAQGQDPAVDTARPRQLCPGVRVRCQDGSGHDAYVWPTELADHLMFFAETKFYAGVAVDIYLTQLGTLGPLRVRERRLRRPVHGPGSEEVADFVRGIQPTSDGFLQHRLLVGNEDVSLGRLFKRHWEEGPGGTLNMNAGAFNWSSTSPAGQGTGASSEFAAGDPRFLLRACPWRHSKELKYPSGYLRQWENRHVKGCRCNCPEEYSPEEADAARRAFEARRGRFRTVEELDAWREGEKAKQRAQNQREKESAWRPRGARALAGGPAPPPAGRGA
ncbi:unnamed protein product, partial [Prorocentrum cordatum]